MPHRDKKIASKDKWLRYMEAGGGPVAQVVGVTWFDSYK